MKKTTIYIIDDHQLIRDMWAFIFMRLPELELAGDSGDQEKALEEITKLRPNIIFLDINMLPLSGFDLLPLIRKQSPSSKVLAVTMVSQPSYAKKAISLGARGYLTKNSPRTEVLEAIVKIVKGEIYICSEIKDLLANEMIEPDGAATAIKSLSKRELEIGALLLKGYTSKQIAETLNIGTRTVDVHRYNMLTKLNVHNTASLINLLNKSDITGF